jgi:membrane-bound lytic murein transglycosylase A
VFLTTAQSASLCMHRLTHPALASAQRIAALCIVCLQLLSFLGCARPPATGPHDAFRKIQPPTIADDLALEGLVEAIDAQSNILRNSSSTTMKIGPLSISRGEYQAALEQLRAVLRSERSLASKLDYIRDHFTFFEFFGGDSWGEVLLTSYFEPSIAGSLTPTKTCTRPLYGRPADLVSIPLPEFSERFKDEKPLKGRVLKDRVVPFFSREEIDGKRALQGRGLELVWVDPIDAFFLQIQGSGTVVLPSGEQQSIVYADKNGHRYEPIGKFLKDQIAPHTITMQRIEALLRRMSAAERDRTLFLNPSYVFFKRATQRAITAIGAPATPGRTIAVDPRYAPKGALAMLQFEKPVFKPEQIEGDDPAYFERSSRFVIDQDSGGAITGTNRVDLFWGRGADARKYAGVLQNKARLIYLVPTRS